LETSAGVAAVGLALLAALLALALTPLVARLAWRLDVVDKAGGHHGDGRAVPMLGGLAIAAAGALALAIAAVLAPGALAPLEQHVAALRWTAPAALAILALGVVDDVRGVGPLRKLAAQSCVALLVLAGGYGFGAITNPLTGGHIDLGPLAPLATVLWIVGITNAFNLIDGLDGLAAGVALIAALTLLGVAVVEGRLDALLLWATLAGCLFGFLVYNFPPASIFLGDSGSLLLGFVVAVLSVQSLQKGAAAVVVAVPLLTLGLPIVDASYAIVRRWLVSGAAAIVRADRDHIHHRLLRSGFSDRGAVLVLYGCCAAFSIFAFLAVVARGPYKSMLVALAAAGAFFATRYLDRRSSADERPRRTDAAAEGDR
jgi:UDP-GlcNAc:undecaprenyl-phosphate/decaprenyl-phosphate GlcNAc-1-phosphate transferase